MNKKKIVFKRILSITLLLGVTFTSNVFASSWSTTLNIWMMDKEISKTVKRTSNATYYMKVDSVGRSFSAVEHWIEGKWGGNYSKHTITKIRQNDSPKSSAKKGDTVVLNVCNPINTLLEVSASGA